MSKRHGSDRVGLDVVTPVLHIRGARLRADAQALDDLQTVGAELLPTKLYELATAAGGLRIL
jgi:hypothetical protein